MSPLPCALVLAALIAMCGQTPAMRDERADDREVDQLRGTIGGPIVRTRNGWGAPLASDGTTIWLWSTSAIAPGDRVVVAGRLRAPRGASAPGAGDARASLASRGAAFEVTADHIEHLGTDERTISSLWRWAAAVQSRWSERIAAVAPSAAGAALRGIVTGDRSAVPDALDQRWRATGIYHVLSVSGLHLAVIGGLVFALLVRVLAASPWGGRIRPTRWAAPLALVAATAYTLVTGAQVATVRAFGVLALALTGKALDRPLRLVDALGAVAIVLLVWRPEDLHDASFQLSFTAALTLALRPRAAPSGSWIRRYIVAGIATSAAVTLTTAPLTAWHFQQISAGGIIGNLVLTPVVELLALPLGLAGVLIGELVPPLGNVLITVAAAVVTGVDHVAGWFARVMPIGTIAISRASVAVALVAIAMWLAMRSQRGRRELAAWLAICVLWWAAPDGAPAGTLRVSFLDVGQGDAALLELPGGEVWLVDAGGLPNAQSPAAAAAPGRTVTRALAAFGKTAIDRAIISHPHPDHYLGLLAIDAPIRELWAALPPDAAPADRAGFGAVTAQLALRGTRLVTPELGRHVATAGVELEVLWPRYDTEPLAAADPVRTVNDNSLVVVVRYAGRSLLFAGDLELEGEEGLVHGPNAPLGHVDVVKVPHHGSRTSSSPGFVAATHPELAVISCGVANLFGFPSGEVVHRWQAGGARVERTDLGGTITVTVSRSGELRVERFLR